jgi:hypothetical protein
MLLSYAFNVFSVHKSHRTAVAVPLPENSEMESKEKEDVSKEVKRTSLPDIVDQKELITLLRNDKKIGFLYMIYAISRASEFYSPYCLTYVKCSLNVQSYCSSI